MRKLLLQLDTDPQVSAFDHIVACDGGAELILPCPNVTPELVCSLVEGAVFTRAPQDKKNTAIWVGGSDLERGEQVFAAIQRQFFGNFRVSVMLDSNGANTTAAAAVATLAQAGSLRGAQALLLGGTGPVGQRCAVMLAQEGVVVALAGRDCAKTALVCAGLAQRFGIAVTPVVAPDGPARAAALAQYDLVMATGAAGVALLRQDDWQDQPRLRWVLDANATPPAGIAGVDARDRGTLRAGKSCYGALGFGPLKLKLQRACIARLFETNSGVWDAHTIYELAGNLVRS